ncbi:hypothetical protein [Halorussus amylolyticus]|uniref:hypothetical protein n=1 Tax=Halorussus amylolyticus TaxID=1126242 RepID=UPI001051F3AE|nr:hypothetical protein [Halorussus amylolyticus]
MSRLYLVPVGEEWTQEFDRTVDSPHDLSGDHPIDELSNLDEARIWGTTSGERKRTFFEGMETGDPLLFYNQGEFFATGRVGHSFESPEAGKWLWNNSDSRFIYTVEDFHRISIPRIELNMILGYSEDYSPQGFQQISEKAMSRLLQQYTSIEDAFQDFRTRSPDVERESEGHTKQEPELELEEEADETNVREHTEIQWYLIQLGLKHNYDVYVATNDQNQEYENERLGEGCIENLNLTGFSEAAMRIIEYVDVIWLNGDYIVKMFEVESTTSIYSGILRMTDFVVKVPNLSVDMYIVAPSDDEDKVRREMDRPTFQRVLEPAEHCSLQYVSFEDVRDTHETVERAGPLQNVF